VPDPRPLLVLLNAQAGPRRQADADRIARILAEHEVVADVEAVEPRDLTGSLRRLAGRDAVGVAGGDGTLRTAARALAGASTTLVPFPTGTLNHFARRLGIDSIDAAAVAVRAGRVRVLPVGRANDHVFLNTAVIGAYPRLVELRQRMQPYVTKWPAAALASAVLLARWPQVRLTARMPASALEARTAMFWVGVGRGSFPAVHESPVPDPGETLEAVVLPGTGRRAAFVLMAAVIRDRFGNGAAVERAMDMIRAPWFEIEGDHALPIALDGEPRRLEPPFRIRLDPQALRVMVGGRDHARG
jgi:diacylglycerol kinase family enzyme